MKSKAILITIILILLSTSIIVNATNIVCKSTENSTNDGDIIKIRVALYTDEKEDADFYSPYQRVCYFVYSLRNYSWTVGDKTYSFIIDLFPTKRLYTGELNKENYDVLIFPVETFDKKFSISLFNLQLRNELEKKLISNFIKEGGGYFGACGGAIVAGEISHRPEALFEYFHRNYQLEISAVQNNLQFKLPLLRHLTGQYNKVSSQSAYYWYSGANQTNYDINYHTGTCIDVNISKNHPIFDDFIGDTRRIRVVGGPELIVPDITDREVNVLAKYPKLEISDNSSTAIHHWKYTGGLKGILKGIFPKGTTYYHENLGVFFNIMCYSGDWEPTDEIVETKRANTPFMTSEIYPNENEGRLVLCSGHPEKNVWWGGHIEEVEDVEYNTIYEGLYRWEDIIPEEVTPEDEFTYNYCIVRRSIAWASQKVPDSDLPVVYGESEVCDFKDENYPLEFNVSCNVKLEDDLIELDLYYRHSDDLMNWSEYKLFGTDNDGSDGFGFEFDSPDGAGYYEFYSIRRVISVNSTIERVPPGADSAVFVEYN